MACAAAALLAAETSWPTSEWPVSTPEEQGMDSTRLEAADAWIRANSPNRYSFLVIRHGKLVFERYYNGRTAESREHLASISKSYLSALIGIAIEQGTLSLDDRWFDTFPEYTGVPADPRTTEVRLRDMLRMSLGLAWNDDDITNWMWDPDGRLYPDWLKYTLQQPFENPPGEAFLYNTGDTHLLSALLTRRTGMTTRDFAAANLLSPMGIWDFDWWRGYGVGRYYTGGWGMVLRARDVAKLGYLYLHDGMWEDRQLVPAEWVKQSTSPQIRYNRAADDFYGYLWWMDNWRGFFIPQARGKGGQYIWFSRELDLVAVTTSDMYNDRGGSGNLVRDYVIPSLFRGAPVVSGAERPVATPDSFVRIRGENLTPAEVRWESVILDGTTLPTTLGGVSVRIGGRSGYLRYASPTEVLVLLPPDIPPGNAEIEVTHPGGTARTGITVAATAPVLYAVFRENGDPVEPGRPARAGDRVRLRAGGLGATARPHPTGEVLKDAYEIADARAVKVWVGLAEARVESVVMEAAGEWQVTIEVPANVAAGDAPVTVQVASDVSPAVPMPVVR